MNEIFNMFGYWVGPEGQVVPIDHWQAHGDKAREILEELGCPEHDAVLNDAYQALHSRDWIPISINQYTGCVNFMTRELTVRQRAALCKIVDLHGENDANFYINGEVYTEKRAALMHVSRLEVL